MLRDILKTTHQIAGPLDRFQGVLKQMGQGKRVEKVELRKHDMLVDFQKALNEFIEARNQELDLRDMEHKEHKEMKSCDFANNS